MAPRLLPRAIHTILEASTVVDLLAHSAALLDGQLAQFPVDTDVGYKSDCVRPRWDEVHRLVSRYDDAPHTGLR